MASEHVIPSPLAAQRVPVAWRGWRWLGVLLAIMLWSAVAVMLYGNAFVRTRMESALNAQLKGYTVTLPRLDLNLFGFSVTLRDVRITQDAHPKPPVAYLPALNAGVDWRALLSARMVATFHFEDPELYINLKNFSAEMNDKTKLSDRGWQQAAEEVYPLKINRFQVDDGKITYIDKDPKQPMEVENLYVRVDNIRNVRSEEGTYPSPLRMQATVFEKGHVAISGNADLFAEPVAAFDTDIKIENVPLATIKPVAAHANLELDGGVLGAVGHVEMAPKKQDIRLEKVTIDGLRIDYVHTARTDAKETQQVEKATEIARDVSNEATTNVQVDDLHMTAAAFAYVDRERKYRVSLDDADLRLRGVSSKASPPPAALMLKGKFMGAGETVISSQFRPVDKKPEFKLSIQIEPTPLTTMNDIFEGYANFDVVAGNFSFYSELEAKDGRIDGYVKPLFSDMEVYARRQDADKPILNQIYQGLVGSITGLLSNPRTDVATAASVSGRVDNPNVSTLQVILRLIQNAFFGSILPGFENEARHTLEDSSR
jgi:hypothetical protein